MRRTADDVKLAAAVKSDDGFFATFFVASYSPKLVRLAARARLRPNHVTIGSLAVGLGAAAGFAYGTRAGLIVGAILLQASFTLDVVDGQLARYTDSGSEFGAWFDGMVDRTKEYAAYAGLAIGSSRSFHDDVWALAAAALIVQTVRHYVDFSYAAGRGSVSRPARRGAPYWARRIIVLPIGERLLLISITAAVFRPEVTFAALLAWGGLATAYTLAGRVRRTWAKPAPPESTALLERYFDDNVTRKIMSRTFPTGRLAFLLPPASLVIETAVILALAAARHDVAAGYPLIAVVAMHRYDLVYRPAERQPASGLDWVTSGWWQRALTAYALYVLNVVDPGFYVLAGVLAALLCLQLIQAWQDPGSGRGSPIGAAREELA